ncbi:Hypothetical predicted protein [Paramuricea clavata]|uniref:Uncharacterized protein n=1 Tax=Paramuricea clavata TaxID=317549 RepID=A0A6S7GML3_PARCT|nr:Hypothetical predicted protein [Paramuricea clavata]
MAELVRQDMFEAVLLRGLDSSKNDLIKSGLDFWSTKDAIDELKRLIPLVAKKFLGKYGEGQKFTVVKAFPMLSRIVQRWYKTFMRRMIAKCGERNPWRVTFSEYLSIDLFNIMQQIIARSSYGVICMSTKKRITIVFSNDARVRNVFCELMDCKILKKDFLKRLAKGKGKVEAVINTEKQFGTTYLLEKEEITFDFY